MQKEKRVERVGYEQSNSLPLPTIWIVGHRDLPLQRAEVVGSNPTRSISLCEGNTAYFDFNLDNCRAITLAMPDLERY
jgi:hypothetical protein